MISEKDFSLLNITDSPSEVVDIISRSQDSLGKLNGRTPTTSSFTRGHKPMTVLNRLATALDRRDEGPNVELAHAIVKAHDSQL